MTQIGRPLRRIRVEPEEPALPTPPAPGVPEPPPEPAPAEPVPHPVREDRGQAGPLRCSGDAARSRVRRRRHRSIVASPARKRAASTMNPGR